MAITINIKNYPLVVAQVAGVSTPAETQAYIDRLDDLLAQENLFGIVVHKIGYEPKLDNDEDKQNAKASHHLVIRWAKAHKLKMKQYCVGMALVDPNIPTYKRPFAPKALGFVFGCPGRWCEDLTAAQDWLGQQLNQVTP
ncbi:MAG: hypothetical protein AAGG51_25900 [Cyanobacteria bacterium P01_G01_bin.54]